MTEQDYPALAVLDLEKLDDNRFRAASVPDPERTVVFGGQLLGQMIVAANLVEPAKKVRSVHAIFARAGDIRIPIDVDVDVIHQGRTLSSFSVRMSQGDRLICQGLVLSDVGEPDLISESQVRPVRPGPLELEIPGYRPADGSELRFVDNVDVGRAAANGPSELDVWSRWATPDGNQAVHQALCAWWTDPFLIPAAMRPHEGVALSMAHQDISTGVLAHTMTFHQDLDAGAWLLNTQVTRFSGHGRGFGEGAVFAENGALVASFSQEFMIRRVLAGATGRAAAM